MAHIGEGEACGGVQQGVPSANVAKFCRPLETCLTLDVDHGATCT